MEKLVPQGLPTGRLTQMNPEETKYFREFAAQRKDGSPVPIEAVFSYYESADGLFELISFVDITRRKQSEQALRESYEQRLQAEAARAEAEAANARRTVSWRCSRMNCARRSRRCCTPCR